MKYLNNFLTSGHEFSKDESFQLFRFSFLNVLMVFASFFTLMNCLASMSGAIDFGPVFEKATIFYVIVSVFVIYSLRKNKAYYPYVVNFFIATSLSLFYFVLLTRPEDEFRLVAFFLALFISYVLLGKKYGVLIYLLVLGSIVFIDMNYTLSLSDFALSTFFTFFTIFSIFLFFFSRKVEMDTVEFQLLNQELKEKVLNETKQRMEQEQMLLRQCRMADMGGMLDSIAHQWRQPLMHINSILLNMDKAIHDEKPDSQILTEKVDEISSLTEHMSQTVEDFRDLFKPEKNVEEFELGSVVDDVLTLMENQFFDIELKVDSLKSVTINGSRAELIQVIIIILSNAVEALKLKQISHKKINISLQKTDNEYSILIEDNAGGVKSEYLNNIFDPYFTSKNQSGGTGLGLYIANIIITQKMKGKLSVVNTFLGAQFSITLIKSLN